MKTLSLTNSQMQLLDNIIAFRVLCADYPDDIKEEMRQVRDQIAKEMKWT